MRVFLLLLVLASTGCSTTQSASNAPASESAVLAKADASGNLNAVATDLVSAMASLRMFPPLSTTIQFSEPEFRFGHEVVKALRASGFGTQKVSEDQGPHYIEIERDQIDSDTSSTVQMRYSINVANVIISRLFESKGNSLIPTSTILIQGASPQPILKRGDIYGSSVSINASQTAFEFEDSDGNFLTRITPGIIQTRSNTDQTYYPVKQLLIRFTPDSLDIGRNNKSAINILLNSYSEENRFTVSACHQTNTPLWDGSDEIAIQRGKRVMQELLTLGVSKNNIFSEDCSSDNYNRLLEKFSVVLTLENTNPTTSRQSSQGRARYGFF